MHPGQCEAVSLAGVFVLEKCGLPRKTKAQFVCGRAHPRASAEQAVVHLLRIFKLFAISFEPSTRFAVCTNQ
jgi:hypothetical protein